MLDAAFKGFKNRPCIGTIKIDPVNKRFDKYYEYLTYDEIYKNT